MQSVQGSFIADGGAMNFDIGFKPTYIEAYSALGGTELGKKFFQALLDAETSGQYGVAIANAGDVSVCADAANGFAVYDEGEDIGVMIQHPGSGKMVLASVADWLAATSYAAGERSATAVGTIVRPPIHNGRVFELTTDTDVGTSEPSSWDVEPGETVTDGGANIWTCRKEIVKKSGGAGFTIGATISTDSEIWVFRAVQDDRLVEYGDIDGYDPIKFPT